MAKVISSTFDGISLTCFRLIFSNGTWDVREQGNRTGNPKISSRLFRFPSCIPCPAGQRPPAPAPGGRQVWGRQTTCPSFSRWSHADQVVLQAFVSFPGGHFLYDLPGYSDSRNNSITFKYKCYGN